MLGAALGIERTDKDKQEQLCNLATAIAVYHSGQVFQDFHTFQSVPKTQVLNPETRAEALGKAKKLETRITYRSYVTDCIYEAVIWRKTEDTFTLEYVKNALKQPHFIPYLGRKSCPLAAPMNPEIIKAKNSVEALNSTDLNLSFINLPFTLPTTPRHIITEEAGGHDSEDWVIDDPSDRNLWHFSRRPAYSHYQNPQEEDTKI